jgi:hypothetical protein
MQGEPHVIGFWASFDDPGELGDDPDRYHPLWPDDVKLQGWLVDAGYLDANYAGLVKALTPCVVDELALELEHSTTKS